MEIMMREFFNQDYFINFPLEHLIIPLNTVVLPQNRLDQTFFPYFQKQLFAITRFVISLSMTCSLTHFLVI